MPLYWKLTPWLGGPSVNPVCEPGITLTPGVQMVTFIPSPSHELSPIRKLMTRYMESTAWQSSRKTMQSLGP